MRVSGTANLKSRQRGHFTGRSSANASGCRPLRARPVLPPAPTIAAPSRSAARRAAPGGQAGSTGRELRGPEPADQPAPQGAAQGPSGGVGERELFPIPAIREMDPRSPSTGRRRREAAKMVARAAACRACAARAARGWRRGRGLVRAERREGRAWGTAQRERSAGLPGNNQEQPGTGAAPSRNYATVLLCCGKKRVVLFFPAPAALCSVLNSVKMGHVVVFCRLIKKKRLAYELLK